MRDPYEEKYGELCPGDRVWSDSGGFGTVLTWKEVMQSRLGKTLLPGETPKDRARKKLMPVRYDERLDGHRDWWATPGLVELVSRKPRTIQLTLWDEGEK